MKNKAAQIKENTRILNQTIKKAQKEASDALVYKENVEAEIVELKKERGLIIDDINQYSELGTRTKKDYQKTINDNNKEYANTLRLQEEKLEEKKQKEKNAKDALVKTNELIYKKEEILKQLNSRIHDVDVEIESYNRLINSLTEKRDGLDNVIAKKEEQLSGLKKDIAAASQMLKKEKDKISVVTGVLEKLNNEVSVLDNRVMTQNKKINEAEDVIADIAILENRRNILKNNKVKEAHDKEVKIGRSLLKRLGLNKK